MHITNFSNRKFHIGLLVAVIFGANALAMVQMARIDLQDQLVEMGYLSEEGVEAGAYMAPIPPRKPDFSRRVNERA